MNTFAMDGFGVEWKLLIIVEVYFIKVPVNLF